MAVAPLLNKFLVIEKGQAIFVCVIGRHSTRQPRFDVRQGLMLRLMPVAHPASSFRFGLLLEASMFPFVCPQGSSCLCSLLSILLL